MQSQLDTAQALAHERIFTRSPALCSSAKSYKW